MPRLINDKSAPFRRFLCSALGLWAVAAAGCGAGTSPPAQKQCEDDVARPRLESPRDPEQRPDERTLRIWSRACLIAHADGAAVQAEGVDASLQRECDALCRKYQVYLISTPGIWGDTTMLMVLGLMSGTRIATYELRPSGLTEASGGHHPSSVDGGTASLVGTATATCDSPSWAHPPAGERPARAACEAHFAQWLGAAQSPREAHLINLNRGHWRAFVPLSTPDENMRGGTPVAGQEIEAGGGGDCMYYAFLASLAAQYASGGEQQAHGAAREQMLGLRHDLGRFLHDHWHTPVSEIGGAADNTSTLGDLSRFEEPRAPTQGSMF